MENHTAKHFVLQLGSLISLYLSLSFLLVLLFALINLLFPDATDTIWQVESASSNVRIGIAMTIVFFPAYLILTRAVNQARRQDTGGSYLGLTKWLIYLSLLIGGIVLLSDLVVVIMTFLEGEITQRFVLKALSVFVVVGAAFFYYLRDARGYWLQHERQSRRIGLAAFVVVLVVMGAGFMHIATPAEVREGRLDETQIADLQYVQQQLQEYLYLNETLPTSRADLSVAATVTIPDAPEDRPAYRYERTEKGFVLCATFETVSEQGDAYSRPFAAPVELSIGGTTKNVPTIINPNDWSHGTGEVCFERVVR